MKKNLTISTLLDVYGKVLTRTQYDMVDYYYNEDLSLAEIAEHFHISRQGVRDAIKRGEHILLDMEEKLKVFQKIQDYQKGLEEIKEKTNYILQLDNGFYHGELIQTGKSVLDIIETLEKGGEYGL